MKKLIPILVVILIVVAGGAFYGGMLYGKSQNGLGDNFANLTAEQRQARFGQSGGAGIVRIGNGQGAGGFISGDIIAKDDKSVTVKLQAGGSKIIFFSDKTQVMKSDAGALADLAVGTTISASGTANADGSVTAQSIQIRPKAETVATPPATPPANQ